MRIPICRTCSDSGEFRVSFERFLVASETIFMILVHWKPAQNLILFHGFPGGAGPEGTHLVEGICLDLGAQQISKTAHHNIVAVNKLQVMKFTRLELPG